MARQTRRWLLKAMLAGGTAASLSACARTRGRDLYETISGIPELSTLRTGIDAAGLAPALDDDRPLTLFAPTNSAFAALPPGTVETLLQPANQGRLISILGNHAITGIVSQAQLVGQRLNLETIEGRTLFVDGTEGVVVGGARIVQPDIFAVNGVIHVIDRVLFAS